MLVGEHPNDGDVHSSYCYYSWVFECDYKAPGKTERCPRTQRVRCNGGPHILLGEAYEECLGQGWTLQPDGTGWRCFEHKDAPMTAPKRAKGLKKGAPVP